jgi:hypothetical protein
VTNALTWSFCRSTEMGGRCATISMCWTTVRGSTLAWSGRKIGQTYNIRTGCEMTNLEMVEILLEELGKPLQPDPTCRGLPRGTTAATA